ncbi:MAG: diaminopropionate ammonia-lyase [Sphaerochaetaceae bacterium]|nr:diaminopropionate ammonia-lyase [Sphaerochaetaceae bacterium]
MEKIKNDYEYLINNPSKDITHAREMFSVETARTARHFHRQIPGYKMTRLVSLSELAHMIGVEGIYIKDEAQRLVLNSFKVMGGSFALYNFLKKRLGSKEDLSFEYLKSKECHDRIGDITFASATDGNHGRGIAWASQQLGYKCVIYVHNETSQPRIDAIRGYGARVEVVDGNYDDAVRKIAEDAKKYNWEIISDTSWDGYTEIPTWIMQGYTTILLEAQEQLAGLGIARPTHVFVQAGVGALAAATVGFYAALYPENPPKFVIIEPEKAPCIYESMKAGKCVSVKGDLDTIMAGLACGDPSPIAFDILKDNGDVFVKVPDYVAARGMRILSCPLTGDPFVISGESGAVTLGALFTLKNPNCPDDLKKALSLDKHSNVLMINTEGNTDPIQFRRVIWDGLDPVPKKFTEIDIR